MRLLTPHLDSYNVIPLYIACIALPAYALSNVQDGISRSVSSALKLRLLAGQGEPSGTRGNAEAYNLYLQGQYFRARQSREDLANAVSYYEQALALDPGHARAWLDRRTDLRDRFQPSP